MDIEIPQAVEQAYRWPVSVAGIHSSGADALQLIIDNYNLSATLIRQMKKIIIISIVSYLASIALIQAQVISDSILVDGNYRTFHHNKPGSLKKGS